MRVPQLRFFALLLGGFFLSTAYAETGEHIIYSEPLQNIQFDVTSTTSAQKVSVRDIQSLRFDAFSKRFDIRLQSNHALLSAERRNALNNSIGIYRGDIASVPGSWVRLVIVDGVPRGLVWDGQEMFAIDPGANEGEASIYRLDDLQIAAGILSCSLVGSPKTAGSLFKAVVGEMSTTFSKGEGATSQLDMAIIGDFEFTSARGASAEADLIARMNNVDGLFSAQLGVQLNVNRLDTYPTASDPFTDELDSSLLIDELADFRNITPTQNSNGLTHLFTGRNLATTTVGIAFSGALCSRRFGAGLTQGTHTLTTDSLIAAHEIGHNFGAPHDGTSGSACEAEPETFIMAPSVNGSNQFSACSISEMLVDVAAASCITSLPSTDVAVVAGGQPPVTLLGNSAALTFTVNSIGTNDADNVTFDVTIPASVSLTDISASAGTCSSGAGSASCSIGTLAAGSGANVSINVLASSTGNADFVATISATADANSNNNQSTIQLTTDPAVDLLATAAGNVQVGLNQSTTISPTVENRATLTATGVTITVTPDAGLQLDSASWSQGSCSIAAGVASCQAATIAAQSIHNVDLQITGTSEGVLSYAISATANEADINVANNGANGQVTVGNVVTPPPANSGGGGAFGWLTIALLLVSRRCASRTAVRTTQID